MRGFVQNERRLSLIDSYKKYHGVCGLSSSPGISAPPCVAFEGLLVGRAIVRNTQPLLNTVDTWDCT